MEITLYTFEDENGLDDGFNTFDRGAALARGKKRGLRVIEHTFRVAYSVALADYRTNVDDVEEFDSAA